MPDFEEIFKQRASVVQEDPEEMWLRGTRPEDFLRDTAVGGETIQQRLASDQAKISGGATTSPTTPPQGEAPEGYVYAYETDVNAYGEAVETRRLVPIREFETWAQAPDGSWVGIRNDGSQMRVELPGSAQPTTPAPIPEAKITGTQIWLPQWLWNIAEEKWIEGGWRDGGKTTDLTNTFVDPTTGITYGRTSQGEAIVVFQPARRPPKPEDAGKQYSEGGYDWKVDYDWDPLMGESGDWTPAPQALGRTKETGMTEAERAALGLRERELHLGRQRWESDVMAKAKEEARLTQEWADKQNLERVEKEERERLEWANFLANPRNAPVLSWLMAGKGAQETARALLPEYSRYKEIWEQEGRPTSFPPTPPGSTGPPRPPGAPPPNIFDYPTGGQAGEVPTQATAWEMFKTGQTQLPGFARPYVTVPTGRHPWETTRITAGTEEYETALGAGYEPTMPQQTSAFATAMRVPSAYEFLSMTPEARMTKVGQLSQAGFPMETEADLAGMVQRQQAAFLGGETGETAGAAAALSQYQQAQETARKQRERQRFIPGITRAMRGPSIFRSR